MSAKMKKLSAPEKKYIKYVLGGVSAFALICIASSRIQTIESGYVGVVHNFGVVDTRKILQPGLHIIPFGSRVEKINAQFSDLDFTNTSDDAKNDAAINALTKDGVYLRIPLEVNWAINTETLALIKSKLPGYYTDREYTIIRAAVKDAIATFNYEDLSDRDVVELAIEKAIKYRTTRYYAAQGFGDQSNHIIRYGLVNLRGMWNDSLQAKAQDIAEAHLEAQANAERTAVPKGRSTADYTKVLEAQATAKALSSGNANVTVITGNTPSCLLYTSPSPRD